MRTWRLTTSASKRTSGFRDSRAIRRFLLASPEFPTGLANSPGLVGKRLMLHPFGTVVGLFDDDLGSTHGLWGQHIHSLQFYETDASRGFMRGAKWGLQPTGGPISMN